MNREYPRAPLMGVGALIVDESRIVLVRRGSSPSQGQWSIPGGLVEIGERLTDAAAREAREETGLEVETGPLLELLERIFRDREGRVQYHYVLADYLCRAVGGSLCAGSDATEARWVDVSELQDYELPDVTMEVIMKAIK